MKEIQIIYRKGYPTLKSLNELIKSFDPNLIGLKPSSIYPHHPCIICDRKQAQNRIHEFIDFASNLGLKFGKLKDYDSPTTGSLEILKQ